MGSPRGELARETGPRELSAVCVLPPRRCPDSHSDPGEKAPCVFHSQRGEQPFLNIAQQFVLNKAALSRS